MVNVNGAPRSTPPRAVPPSSCATTVIVETPFASGAGAYASVPVASIDGGVLKRLGFELPVTENETCCADSSVGPGEIALAPAVETGASSRLVTLPAVNAGASFTGSTVSAKVTGALWSTPPFDVPPSSCATTLTVATPFAFGAGV